MNEEHLIEIIDYLEAMNVVMVKQLHYIMLIFFVVSITCGMIVGRMIARK